MNNKITYLGTLKNVPTNWYSVAFEVAKNDGHFVVAKINNEKRTIFKSKGLRASAPSLIIKDFAEHTVARVDREDGSNTYLVVKPERQEVANPFA